MRRILRWWGILRNSPLQRAQFWGNLKSMIDFVLHGASQPSCASGAAGVGLPVSPDPAEGLAAWVSYLRDCQDKILAERGGVELPGDSTEMIRDMHDNPRRI